MTIICICLKCIKWNNNVIRYPNCCYVVSTDMDMILIKFRTVTIV